MKSKSENNRPVVGLSILIVMFAIFGFSLIPLRSHISVATSALILVVPVVIGVTVGGFLIGVVGVVVGFLLYDYVFIPPYYTLTVGASQNWVALGVYAIVVLLVSKVVSDLKQARHNAFRISNSTRELFELSQLLVGERNPSALLHSTADALHKVFGFDSVLILTPNDFNLLEPSVHLGPKIPQEEIDQVVPRVQPGGPTRLSFEDPDNKESPVRAIPLSSSGSLVGIVITKGQALDKFQSDLLSVFINQSALSLHKAILRNDAERALVLEEIDKWRKILLETVSHDLRTPLSSIKAAASDLVDPVLTIDPADRDLLLTTIVSQSDRLASMVFNLLDATKIESGTLIPHLEANDLIDVVSEGIKTLGNDISTRVIMEASDVIHSPVNIDSTLIARAVGNLVENAVKYARPGSMVKVFISQDQSSYNVLVSNEAPALSQKTLEEINLTLLNKMRFPRRGLGIWIAKTFVELHQGEISFAYTSSSHTSTFQTINFQFTIPRTSLEEKV